MLYKNAGAVTDVDTTTRTVVGYFSTTGVWDDVGDMIMPGAFRKTIAERGPLGTNRIKHLWMHEAFYPLGVPSELIEDDTGLRFATTIVDTSFGRDVVKLYEAGVINEHSIGFDIPTGKAEFVTAPNGEVEMMNGYQKRVIHEVQLWEGSSVVWGANPLTPTVSVKSATPDEINQALTRLASRIEAAERSLKRGHLSTDEIADALEVALRAWKAQLQALIGLQEPAHVATPTPEEPSLAQSDLTALVDVFRAAVMAD